MKGDVSFEAGFNAEQQSLIQKWYRELLPVVHTAWGLEIDETPIILSDAERVGVGRRQSTPDYDVGGANAPPGVVQ